MTGQEVLRWIRKKPFVRFRITMNNGHTIDVLHPELAEMSADGALYIHDPATSGDVGLTACDIRNICTLTLLPNTAS